MSQDATQTATTSHANRRRNRHEVDDNARLERTTQAGRNADLYVLIDPCDDDKIEMVSVGSSRIEIVDEISC
jgi:hypothetical protein